MEYFTRAWGLGELPDDEFERVDERYQALLASLEEDDPVRRFATAVSLNDAYVDRLAKARGVLSLRLLTGDLQRGYWHTVISYGGGEVILGEDVLARAIAMRPTEIWYDEFSVDGSRRVHRFLLVEPGTTEDRGEVHIAFDDVAFSQSPAGGRELGKR